MNVTIDHENGYVLARVTGTIDNITAEEFGKKVGALVEEHDANVLLDMSGAEYMNSEGLGKLIAMQQAAKQKSKRVMLISPAPLVAQVILASNLDAFLPIVDSEDDAVAALADC